jgi:formamidase
VCCSIELSTSPHDVEDEYEAKYGWEPENLFPVTDTPIGRLGTYICYDGHFPEVARALALNGAEVLIRPTAYLEPWTSEPMDWWTVLNRARAIENTCYVIAPTRGNIVGPPGMPREWSGGRSQIIDFEGRILCMNKTTGECVIGAVIDVEHLRKRRMRKVDMNHLAHLRPEAYVKVYQKAKCWPDNQWAAHPPASFADTRRATKTSVEGLVKKGIYKP